MPDYTDFPDDLPEISKRVQETLKERGFDGAVVKTQSAHLDIYIRVGWNGFVKSDTIDPIRKPEELPQLIDRSTERIITALSWLVRHA